MSCLYININKFFNDSAFLYFVMCVKLNEMYLLCYHQIAVPCFIFSSAPEKKVDWINSDLEEHFSIFV